MRCLVIGGHARGIGKTALVVDVIRAFPEAGWTAVKISQHGHGAWPDGAGESQATAAGLAAVLEEEKNRAGASDSSRFLAAGARRAFWLRVRPGRMAEGMPILRETLQGTAYVILESNSVMGTLRPELCLMVLDPSAADFKASAMEHLASVDAFIRRGALLGARGWPGVPDAAFTSKPIFEQRLGEPLPEGLRLLIRNKLFADVHPRAT